MSRKTRPYLFYDTTASVCSKCLERVEAKILLADDEVILEKWCPEHGFERALLSEDPAWYRACRETWLKPPDLPRRFATAMRRGCPYDCGLCPDHMQHSCVSIVEITQRCNLRCPLCYAASGPEGGEHLPLAKIEAMLDALVASEGEPDVVQISGGEPTLHPEFFAVLDAARRRPIRHLMVNTNGIRLADPEFAARLAGYMPGFEVYLQFDSFDDAANKLLRGATLADTRLRALDQLDHHGISTTLVMTVAAGVNDQEIGEVLAFAAGRSCVRGVTLQPVQRAGRVDLPEAPPLTVAGLRRRVAEQSGIFGLDDILPVPCNPDTLAMAYAVKGEGGPQALTRHIPREVLLQGASNTITYETELRDKVVGLLSTGLSPSEQANCLGDLLCCLPKVQADAFDYRQVFRLLIVQFMDASNLDLRALKKSCVHIVAEDGRSIPIEAYNLFYRNK